MLHGLGVYFEEFQYTGVMQSSAIQSSAIKVITFDLDDTLWETESVLDRAEQIVYSWLQLNAPKLCQQFSLSALRDWRINIYQQHPELAHQITQIRKTAVTKALCETGYHVDEASRLSDEAFQVFIEARHQVRFFDTAQPLLTALHGRYKLGALSNGNADIFLLELGQFFDFAFSAEKLNASKPAPDQFHAACKHCGIEATQLIHIGDSLKFDIAGAVNAGCHSIWFNPQQAPLPAEMPQPSKQVSCLSEIPAAIASIEQACNSPLS